ncbi:MAG TPA: hypothetical protein VFS43_40875 [Polyangiaceae bacterium]|nr:hypothetical protein [Polyangiaceae bacterium]
MYPPRKHYTVEQLCEMGDLSKKQVYSLLKRAGFQRPGGPRTKWRVPHDELVLRLPLFVSSHRTVEAAKRGRSAA